MAMASVARAGRMVGCIYRRSDMCMINRHHECMRKLDFVEEKRTQSVDGQWTNGDDVQAYTEYWAHRMPPANEWKIGRNAKLPVNK